MYIKPVDTFNPTGRGGRLRCYSSSGVNISKTLHMKLGTKCSKKNGGFEAGISAYNIDRTSTHARKVRL
jgi:hypothetical protein